MCVKERSVYRAQAVTCGVGVASLRPDPRAVKGKAGDELMVTIGNAIYRIAGFLQVLRLDTVIALHTPTGGNRETSYLQCTHLYFLLLLLRWMNNGEALSRNFWLPSSFPTRCIIADALAYVVVLVVVWEARRGPEPPLEKRTRLGCCLLVLSGVGRCAQRHGDVPGSGALLASGAVPRAAGHHQHRHRPRRTGK